MTINKIALSYTKLDQLNAFERTRFGKGPSILNDSYLAMKNLPFLPYERMYLGIYKVLDDTAHLLHFAPLVDKSVFSPAEINDFHRIIEVWWATKVAPAIQGRKGAYFEFLPAYSQTIHGIPPSPEIYEKAITGIKELYCMSGVAIEKAGRSSQEALTSTYASETLEKHLQSTIKHIERVGLGYCIVHNHPELSDEQILMDAPIEVRQHIDQFPEEKEQTLDLLREFYDAARFEPSEQDVLTADQFGTNQLGLIGTGNIVDYKHVEINWEADVSDGYHKITQFIEEPVESDDWLGFQVRGSSARHIEVEGHVIDTEQHKGKQRALYEAREQIQRIDSLSMFHMTRPLVVPFSGYNAVQESLVRHIDPVAFKKIWRVPLQDISIF